jgi:hypothetical protein
MRLHERTIKRATMAAGIIAASLAAAPAFAGNGYTNMPERGCPTGFSEASSDAFPRLLAV